MNQRGFSLVEILVGLSIISIMASIALLRFNPGQSDLNNISSELCSDTRLIQQLSTNCADKSLRAGYTISISDDGYNLRAGTETKDVIFPDGVSGSTNTIRFNVNGSPCDFSGEELTADQTITLQDASKSKQIVITQLTGRVIVR